MAETATRTRLELLRDLHHFLNPMGKFGECDCPMCSLRKDVAIHLRAEQRAAAPTEEDPALEDTDVEMPQAIAQNSKILREAQGYYEAYTASSGGKNFFGGDCPPFAELPEAVRGHWCAVVRHVRKKS